MKSVSLAAQAIACGAASVAVAGGMESMSRAPHLVRGLRGGLRLGGGALEDSLLVDGLTCAVGRGGPHMGALADAVATASKVTRAAMDAHALESHARAAAAAAGARDADRAHGAEVVPVLAPPPLGARTGGKPTLIIDDDAPAKLAAARVPHLPPAFSPGGCITAATSSPVSDGAAALVLASSTAAAAAGSRVLAHIVATADAAVPPTSTPTPPPPPPAAPSPAPASPWPTSTCGRSTRRSPSSPWSPPPSSGSTRRASTRPAAPSLSATPSAPPGPPLSRGWRTSWRRAGGGWGWRPFATAGAARQPSCCGGRRPSDEAERV